MRATFDDIRPTRLIEQSKPRRPRQRGVSPSVAAVVAIVFAASLVLIAGRDRAPHPTPPPVVAAPLPQWTPIDRPLARFDLPAPLLAHSRLRYAAWRNRSGGGRRDILTFGTLGGAAPFLRLSLYRGGREAASDVPLFVTLVRLGAEMDLAITRSANLTSLPTKFGALETEDVAVAPEVGAPVPCLGFRGAGLAGGFRLSGFACGTKRAVMSRPALACMLDRLELDGGGDRALIGYFAQAELRRGADCGALLDPAAVAVSWIDRNDAPPPLKLRKMR